MYGRGERIHSESDDAFAVLLVASLFAGLLKWELYCAEADLGFRRARALEVYLQIAPWTRSDATQRGALRGAGRVKKWKRGSMAGLLREPLPHPPNTISKRRRKRLPNLESPAVPRTIPRTCIKHVASNQTSSAPP